MKKITAFFISLLLILNSALSHAFAIRQWTVSNPMAVGASMLYDGSKGAVTSSILITPNVSQVAKVLRGGAAGYALSFAVEQLLGAVDWVLDPANNQIIYYKKTDNPNDPAVPYYWSTYDRKFNSPIQAYEYWKSKNTTREIMSRTGERYTNNGGTVWIGYTYYMKPETASSNLSKDEVGFNRSSNSLYDPTTKATLSLETVAQKVIENAENNNIDAQFAVLAAANNILSEAEKDDAKAKPIEDELENSAKCPSGIMSAKGQCWVCTRDDYPIVTQRTKLAKAETSRLGKCLPKMENTELFNRINAFNEFIQARVNENSCWAPLDPGHIQQEQDGRNGVAKCTSYLK